MAGDHARSIPDLRGRPSPDLLRFTPCRRWEQAIELTQPGVRHTWSALTQRLLARLLLPTATVVAGRRIARHDWREGLLQEHSRAT